MILRAGRAQHEARLLLRKQRIFMPKELSEPFAKAIAQLTGVYVHRKLSFQNPGARRDPFGGPVEVFIFSHEQCSTNCPLLQTLGSFAMKPNFQ